MNEIKPILRWPGAKWRIAKWIASYFPEHGTYLEPFFGSGAVFFTKPPSGSETINDIDNNIVNLFKVCRDNPKKLARKIAMTPYSRAEYIFCRNNYKDDICDDIERARRYVVAVWQGFGVAHSRQAAEAQREVTDMTNELLKKNAETLKMATVETAKESERGIVDMETLKTTNESLISTLDEVMQIQAEGRQKRQEAEVEIRKMEQELKEKLLQIR